jgi:hypothetical protein
VTRALWLVGALVGAVALSGCSGGDSSSSSSLGTSSAPSATTASVVRSASVGPVSVAPTSASRAPTTYDFQTATHNIACSMAPSGVRCDIKTHTWTPPAKPATCQNDWAGGMQVVAEKVSFTCAGDTLLGKGATVGRNTIVRNAGYVCAVVTTTVTCTSPGGHGFKLSIGFTSTF